MQPDRAVSFLLAAFITGVVSAATPTDVTDTQREQTLKERISAANIGSYIESMTAHPTFPGAPFARTVAQMTLAKFKAWGWDAKIETFTIPFPRPTERAVELLTPQKFVAKLHEPAVPGDPYSEQQSEHLEPFFIYGPDGDVTAPALYVNFGLRDDYEQLASLGQSVKGKIVIVRAGGMWRGGKVQLAAEHGALAMLIYSDPKEDGYYRGPAYPEGGWRTPDGVQRGSILYGKFPGDPLTPFVAADAKAKRLAINSPENTVARIPALPLSFADAQPILESMQGGVAPESWRGALPITYRVGASSAAVHLKIKYQWKNIEIRDVVARLAGTTFGKEEVVRGNHRDGWVFGAQDPHSGHSAMLEEARVLGELYKGGWRPKRTIVYCSWEAEEQGVIGSTEWVEAHLAELQKNAVAYLNTDVTGPGSLRPTGSSSYTAFVTELAASITDPNSNVSVLKRAQLKAEADIYPRPGSTAMGMSLGAATLDALKNLIHLDPPGYGSDHHAFVSHAGVATVNLAFGDDLNMGSYHTAYDDYAWYERFGDPQFKYGRVTAQINAVAVLRLADADMLPMEFTATARSTDDEVTHLKNLYASVKSATDRSNRAVELGAYQVLTDPTQPRVAPPLKTVPPLDFSALDQATVAIKSAADRFEAAKAAAASAHLTDAQIANVNSALMNVERSYLRKGGLPERPHYRNELFSPGRLWDTVPVPAIGDAILDEQWAVAQAQIPLAAQTLEHIAAAIDTSTAELKKAAGERRR
jgi:N-acetylated-alpha-linked acidic dipeptidase